MLTNITLSVNETMIERARPRASAENGTINAEFRRWLQQYVETPFLKEDFPEWMKQFSYVQSGNVFTRDELNE